MKKIYAIVLMLALLGATILYANRTEAALIYGTALQFDGSTQYARTAHSSIVVDNFTMTAWVKVLACPPLSPNDFGGIFQNGANDARGMTLYLNSSCVLHGDIAFVADVNSAFTLSLNTWYHVAWIRNAGTSQLYVNAVAKGSTSASGPNAANSTDFTTLGAWTSSGGTTGDFTNIIIDDARFYERAITTGELTTLYNNGNAWPYTDISNTSLKMWYKLDDGSGTSAIDSGTAGFALTLTGAPSWVTGYVATGANSSHANGGISGAATGYVTGSVTGYVN